MTRRLQREMASLWVFLCEHGVEPTNNRAERALRFAVMWRKGSSGTQSDKGNRWVESRQTCLAHLIRSARGLSQKRDTQLAACGTWALKELQALCHMAKAPPSGGEGSA